MYLTPQVHPRKFYLEPLRFPQKVYNHSSLLSRIVQQCARPLTFFSLSDTTHYFSGLNTPLMTQWKNSQGSVLVSLHVITLRVFFDMQFENKYKIPIMLIFQVNNLFLFLFKYLNNLMYWNSKALGITICKKNLHTIFFIKIFISIID